MQPSETKTGVGTVDVRPIEARTVDIAHNEFNVDFQAISAAKEKPQQSENEYTSFLCMLIQTIVFKC